MSNPTVLFGPNLQDMYSKSCGTHRNFRIGNRRSWASWARLTLYGKFDHQVDRVSSEAFPTSETRSWTLGTSLSSYTYLKTCHRCTSIGDSIARASELSPSWTARSLATWSIEDSSMWTSQTVPRLDCFTGYFLVRSANRHAS
ncbi:unnamed protein product [Prunus armeniaca]